MIRLEHAGRRFALALVAALFAGAACDPPASVATPAEPTAAAPSFATFLNDMFELSGNDFNPCQPEEWVALQGSIHFQAQVEETPTGFRGTLHANTQGIEGVGLTSGDRYRGIENVNGDFEFSSPDSTFDETFETRLGLVRQGSADNLWLRSTFRFTDPPGTVQIVKSQIECVG
jgi:hypothetical protein